MYAQNALKQLTGKPSDKLQIEDCLLELSNSNGLLHGILSYTMISDQAKECIRAQIADNEKALGLPSRVK